MKRLFRAARITNLFLLAGVFTTMTLVSPVSATGVIDVDQSVTAGAQRSPHMEWTARTFPCNRYVKFVNVEGGIDAGDGTVGNPWQSLKRAFAEAMPGDFVCVEGGIYRENHLVPRNSGTWENPITFLSTGEILLLPDLRPGQEDEAKQPVFDFTSTGSLGYWAIDRFPMDRQGLDGPGVQMLGARDPNVPGGRGEVHHIIVQNTKISNGKAGSGILLRGRVYDVMLRANTVENFQRWRSATAPVDQRFAHSRVDSSYFRDDAHGIAIEGIDRDVQTQISTPQNPGEPATEASVERILIDRNTFINNGGDGLQCLGADPTDAIATTSDPLNIDIVDNKVLNTVRTTANQAIVENAYDIKSCQQVSIRGRAPTAAGGSPQGSKMKEFLPTVKLKDGSGNGNNAEGAAILLHYNARKVLVEYNRIWNACAGIMVGRTDKKVNDIVIRRNMIFGLRYDQAQFDGTNDDDPNTADDAARCKGKAIQITSADRVDIYHNTIDDVPDTAIQVGEPNISDAARPNDVDIWNNIVRLSNTVGIGLRYWVSLPKVGTGVDSDFNVFWHQGGNGADVWESKHFRIDNTNYNLSDWRTTGQRDNYRDAGLVWADPLFVTNPLVNDYYTTSLSPARNGAHPTTTGLNCGAPDIGFLESCD